MSFAIFEDPNRHFRTARERIQAHSTEPICAGRHRLTDPIGLALENFDGAGVFRSTDNDAPIDVSGQLDGQSFKDVSGFGRVLHSDPALGPCLVSRLYAYGVGREMTALDQPWLTFFARQFAAQGYRVPDLLREIATSEAFFAVSSTIPPAAVSVQQSR